MRPGEERNVTAEVPARPVPGVRSPEGDPMRDGKALEHMSLVFKNGIGYKPDIIFDSFRGKVGLY